MPAWPFHYQFSPRVISGDVFFVTVPPSPRCPAVKSQRLAGYFVVRTGASTRPSLRELEVRPIVLPPCTAHGGGVLGCVSFHVHCKEWVVLLVLRCPSFRCVFTVNDSLPRFRFENVGGGCGAVWYVLVQVTVDGCAQRFERFPSDSSLPVLFLPRAVGFSRVSSSLPCPPSLSLYRLERVPTAALNLLRHTHLSAPCPPPAILKVFRSMAASPSASGQLPVLFVASLRLRDGAPTQSFQYQCLTAQGGVGGERGAGR